MVSGERAIKVAKTCTDAPGCDKYMFAIECLAVYKQTLSTSIKGSLVLLFTLALMVSSFISFDTSLSHLTAHVLNLPIALAICLSDELSLNTG